MMYRPDTTVRITSMCEHMYLMRFKPRWAESQQHVSKTTLSAQSSHGAARAPDSPEVLVHQRGTHMVSKRGFISEVNVEETLPSHAAGKVDSAVAIKGSRGPDVSVHSQNESIVESESIERSPETRTRAEILQADALKKQRMAHRVSTRRCVRTHRLG